MAGGARGGVAVRYLRLAAERRAWMLTEPESRRQGSFKPSRAAFNQWWRRPAGCVLALPAGSSSLPCNRGSDPVLQREASLSESDFCLITDGIDTGFGTMNLVVDLVVFLKNARELGVGGLQRVDHVQLIGELLAERGGSV